MATKIPLDDDEFSALEDLYFKLDQTLLQVDELEYLSPQSEEYLDLLQEARDVLGGLIGAAEFDET